MSDSLPPAIALRRSYTLEKLDVLRKRLSADFPCPDATIVTCGSFARLEASDESDLDFFLICQNKAVASDLKDKVASIQQVASKIVPKPAAADGSFNSLETIRDMIENIGGNKDENKKLTRRMLFLLEGTYLTNESKFNEFRKQILRKYVRPEITDHQLLRFLLNDLVRYYRTMCVDFEYKTNEAGKAWAVRNIKLIYSRKLIYFGGLLVVAESAQQTYEQKLETAERLFALSPIDRVIEVCGAQSAKMLSIYEGFLEKLSDPAVRREFEAISADRKTHNATFRNLKNDGHHFTFELARLLSATYHASHPIHTAILF